MNDVNPPELSPIIVDGPPWEKKHELGFFVAFIETLKAFIMEPGKTFSVMRRTAGLGDALIYTVALQVFTFIWTFAINDVDPEMLFPQDPEIRDILALPENISQIFVLIYPLTVILAQFLGSLAIHLSLRWRKLQNYDYSLVFRIVAYSGGTAALFTLLPLVGGLISLSLTLFLIYVGLKTIYGHGMDSIFVTLLLAVPVLLGLYIGVAFGLTILILVISLFASL